MTALKGSGEYNFGEFSYRASDNTLRRNGGVLPMTPKALDLLRVFIANPGKLLSKEELMNELWPDSFVEEGNLAVTIRRLRKALADDAHDPVYIETVARQGYRFVAPVGRPASAAVAEKGVRPRRSFRYLIPVAVTAGLLIASITLGSLYLRGGRSQAAPILAAPFAAEKLSTSGNVGTASISPDGEKIVYTIIGIAGEAVWLREIASGNNVEIIPASNERYQRIAFSPDSSTLFFTRGPKISGEPADVYRVSIFGGVPAKIVSDTRGWISLSSDGGSISFVRCRYRENDYCSLWIARSIDGKNEKMLTSKGSPYRIGDNKITSDGKSVVFAVGQSENAGTDFGLSAVDIATGVEREISTQRFFNIRGLALLPDMSGALVTASRGSTQRVQVWRVGFADDRAEPLTKDVAVYSSISLDDTGSRMVATQVSHNFHLVRSTFDRVDRKGTLVESAWLFSLDSDNGIVFQSDLSGDLEIWRINRDGTSLRQLTNSPGDDTRPIAALGGQDIFFCSNRTGQMQVWVMKSDGSDQRQLTDVEGGFPLFADNEWIYYQHGIDRTLWRVSAQGGVEERVLKNAPSRGPFVFSASGRQAAFFDTRHGAQSVVIVSIPAGSEVRSIPLVDGASRVELAWLPDETAIVYSSFGDDETSTLWTQPINGGPPYKLGKLPGDPIGSLSVPTELDSVIYVQGRWKHDFVMLTGLQ